MAWTCGAALAQSGRPNCAGKPLQGTYATKTTGLLYAPGLKLPNGDAPRLAGVGIVEFDGKGTITFIAGVNSFGGLIVANPPGGFTGTYTLDANCSGTISVLDPIKIQESIYFVLAENGAKLFGMYTTVTGNDPGPVVTIDFVKQ
jgi:hypothetical protein